MDPETRTGPGDEPGPVAVVVPPGRIQLPTSALPRMRSTTELRRRNLRSGPYSQPGTTGEAPNSAACEKVRQRVQSTHGQGSDPRPRNAAGRRAGRARPRGAQGEVGKGPAPRRRPARQPAPAQGRRATGKTEQLKVIGASLTRSFASGADRAR